MVAMLFISLSCAYYLMLGSEKNVKHRYIETILLNCQRFTKENVLMHLIKLNLQCLCKRQWFDKRKQAPCIIYYECQHDVVSNKVDQCIERE